MQENEVNVLFLEDEPTIREVLAEYMRMSGYRVTETARGDAAIALLREDAYDIAVLDVMVPGVDGFEVLQYLRDHCPQTAAIMLTALDDEKTQIKAFNLYADDYVIKPVSPILLLKRMETILRRTLYVERKNRLAAEAAGTGSSGLAGGAGVSGSVECAGADDSGLAEGAGAGVSGLAECAGADGSGSVEGAGAGVSGLAGGAGAAGVAGKTLAAEGQRAAGGHRGLYLEEEAYSAYYGEEKLPLTLSEYLLLQTLYNEPRRAFTREQLILRIYNEEYIGNDRIIDAHVKNLRKKLPVNYVKTLIGVGYQFDGSAAAKENDGSDGEGKNES